MHGCGNDYVFIDAVGGPAPPPGVNLNRLAVELSERHFGVGGDGLILISRAPSGRLSMRMWNTDGSEGKMCGNGMRCLAAYCHREGYERERRFEVETAAGIIVPEVGAETVKVDMGRPLEVIRDLRVTVTGGPAEGSYEGVFVSMGNPHFVVFVPRADDVDILTVGPALEGHEDFADRANVEFVEILARDRLRMRVWERGSGVTLACGTGAAASLVAAVTTGRAAGRAVVVADGGELEVELTPEGQVTVSGPAVEVFRTTYGRPLPRDP